MLRLTDEGQQRRKGSDGSREGNPTDLRFYWRMISKNSWFVVAGALIGLLAGVGLSALTTPQYASTATLYVSVRGGGEAGELYQGASYAQTVMTSYVDIATTSIVLDEVAQELGGEVPRETMEEHLSVESPEGSSLLSIRAVHPDPEIAAELVNTTGATLVDVVQNELEAVATGTPGPVQVRFIDPAVVSVDSISPNWPRNIALGLLLGLTLGIALAILRGSFDTRIHSVADLEEITNIPVVGRIAHDDSIARRPLVVHDAPRSPRAEAFRTTRTNLQFFAAHDNAKVFVVTSPAPDEGKTHVVANLAVVLAESGARVALVEADLRRPRLAGVMGIEGAVGLSDVLIGRATLDDVLQPWGTHNLTVLSSGQIPPNPSELLGSPAMQQVLNQLREQADYVLIDAPPVLPVTDAAILSTYASGCLLIGSIGQTRRQTIEQAIESLENVGGRVLGLIVNRVPMRGSGDSSLITYKYAEKSDHETVRSRAVA